MCFLFFSNFVCLLWYFVLLDWRDSFFFVGSVSFDSGPCFVHVTYGKAKNFINLTLDQFFIFSARTCWGSAAMLLMGKVRWVNWPGDGHWTTGHRPSNMFDEHKYNEYGGWMSSHGYVWDYGRSTLR